MSIRHVAWALDQKTGSPTRKSVLVALANYANDTTGKCCPHISTICDRTELSAATVKRALVDLVEAGLISDRTRNRRPDGTLGGYQYVLPNVRYVAEEGVTPIPDPGIAVRPQEPGTSLEPKTPPVAPPESPGSQEIVAGYVDAVKALGAPAPSRIVGQVARSVKELLDEGVDPSVVERAVALMTERRLHPSTLASLVLEAAAGPRQPAAPPMRYGRGLTTRQILDMTQGGTDDHHR